MARRSCCKDATEGGALRVEFSQLLIIAIVASSRRQSIYAERVRVISCIHWPGRGSKPFVSLRYNTHNGKMVTEANE